MAVPTSALMMAGLSACSKKDPPPAPAKVVSDAATEPPDLGKGFVAPPPGFVPQDEPDAGEPFGKVADWSKATFPGTKITYRYPGDIFLMDEDKTGIVLTSPISVEPVQDDSGASQQPYLFRIKASMKPMSVAECAKDEKVPTMFPDGKKESFVEVVRLAKKLTVASHEAYMQRLIVHGFNATVVLVDFGPKRTLVARIDTVGEELRPRVAVSNWHPEAWQLALTEAVLASFVDPSAPPVRARKTDGGK
jgi:hypothetical protein